MEEKNRRYLPPFISVRRKLISGTMSCLFPLYALFWLTQDNEGMKTLTKKNLINFNLISLRAWIIRTGYWLGPQKYTYRYGFALSLPGGFSQNECTLQQDRLEELGVETVLVKVQDRNCGLSRLVVHTII